MAKNASDDLRVPRATVRPRGTNPVFAQIQALMAGVNGAEPKSGRNTKELLAFLGKLTPGQRFVYAITAFEMETNSGGFDSYFRSHVGNTALAAMEGLKAVGASKFAAVLNKAVALFPKGDPAPDDEKREEQLDAILDRNPEAFEALEQKFFGAYDEEESLAARGESLWIVAGS